MLTCQTGERWSRHPKRARVGQGGRDGELVHQTAALAARGRSGRRRAAADRPPTYPTATGRPTAPQTAALVRELRAIGANTARVEAVPQYGQWESQQLASAVPLARSWERQLDTVRNPLFYHATLTPPPTTAGCATTRWPTSPSRPPRPTARPQPQAGIIRGGQPWLVPVWHHTFWKLYQVTGAAPLASPPATITGTTPAQVTLRMSRPGSTIIRIRWSPLLRKHRPRHHRPAQRLDQPGRHSLTAPPRRGLYPLTSWASRCRGMPTGPPATSAPLSVRGTTNGRIAKRSPPEPPLRAGPGQSLCVPVTCAVSDRWFARVLNERGLSVTPYRVGEDTPRGRHRRPARQVSMAAAWPPTSSGRCPGPSTSSPARQPAERRLRAGSPARQNDLSARPGLSIAGQRQEQITAALRLMGRLEERWRRRQERGR